MNIITPYISRTILKAAYSETNCFNSWMRKYLSAKEFYFIKNNDLYKMPILDIKRYLLDSLSNSNISSDLNLIEFLLRNNNKLNLLLTFIRSGFIGHSSIKHKEKIKLLLEIFSFRIINDKKLSLGSLNKLSVKNENLNYLKIIGPVCPDYSYKLGKNGRYRYTFESVGSGIGLVAEKAIENFKRIKLISSDLVTKGLDLQYEILIGDFEANEQNLNALNENKSNFLKKINLSCKKIEEKTSIKTYPFTNLCQGLDGWDHQVINLKNIYSMYSYDDLQKKFPYINHEKKLISRLPLYKKWFGVNKDYRNIFFNQSVEYMLMGNLIYSHFLESSFLLASDHKAMRDYYSATSNINVISASSNY